MTREQQIAKQCERIAALLEEPLGRSDLLNCTRALERIDEYLQMPCGCGCDCKHLKRCPHNKD